MCITCYDFRINPNLYKFIYNLMIYKFDETYFGAIKSLWYRKNLYILLFYVTMLMVYNNLIISCIELYYSLTNINLYGTMTKPTVYIE